MRQLTERQAQACENAQHPRCRCRCGGALHGAARVGNLRELPRDDPHYPAEAQGDLFESAIEGGGDALPADA